MYKRERSDILKISCEETRDFVVEGVMDIFGLDGPSGDHVHRAEDDLPRKVECGPEVTVENAERARIAPDSADGTRERHERAHLVACGARSKVRSDLGRGDVRKGSRGSTSAACASSGEHSGGNWEKRSHESVEAVRD